MARRLSAAGVVRALLTHLSGHTEMVAQELLALRAVAVISRDGTAVLAPAALIDDLAHVGPRLRRQGLRMVDGPLALVHPARGELVVPAPSLALEPAALDRLAAWEAAEPQQEWVAPGRYPLAAWALWAGEPLGQLSTGRARAWAYRSVVRAEGVGVAGALDRLDQLLGATEAHSVPPALPSLAGRLAALAGTR